MAIGRASRQKHIPDELEPLTIKQNGRAGCLFSNRDTERNIIADFFAIICSDTELPKPILCFHGVAGVGKSALLQRAWDEFQATGQPSPLRLLRLNLDSDKNENISPIELLWQLRVQLHHQIEAPSPLFDLLYLKYKDKNRAFVELNSGPVNTSLHAIAGDSELHESLLNHPHDNDLSHLSEVINKGMSLLWKNSELRAVAQQFNINPDNFTAIDISNYAEVMAKVCAEELGIALIKPANQAQQALSIAIDGFEQIQNKHAEQLFVNSFLSPLLTHPDYSAHMGVLLFSREAINWSAYDKPLQQLAGEGESWQSYIEQHRLAAFHHRQATQFLDNATNFYNKHEQHLRADLVSQYGAQILAASLQLEAGGEPHFLPFYLHLCLKTIEKQGAEFEPTAHLGETSKGLMSHYLQYMDDSTRHIHYALALAGEFNQALWDQLAIATEQTTFKLFIDQYGYLTQQGDHYRFHRLMQDALIAEIATKPEQQTRLRDCVVNKLIIFYDQIFFDRTLSSLTQIDVEHYEQAHEMLFSSVKARLISLADAYAQSVSWDQLFASTFFVLRESWARKWLNLHQQLLGEKHPQSAERKHDLARLLDAQGKYIEAETLHLDALAIYRDIHGENHHDVAASMFWLAKNMEAQGKCAEAEKLHLYNLSMNQELYGEQHHDVEASMFWLAKNLEEQKKYNEAEKLLRYNLAMYREIHGEKHPDVAAALFWLARNLDAQEKYSEAETVHLDTLSISQEIYGENHHDVAASMFWLAKNLEAQGRYSEAEKLHQYQLSMKQEIYGENHHELAISMLWLANNLEHQHKYPEAEKLHIAIISINKKINGDNQVKLAAAMAGHANNLEKQRKYAEAETLRNHILSICQEIYGEKHGKVAASMSWLAKNLEAQGKLAQAEPLRLDVVSIEQDIYGEKHPAVALSMFALASNMEEQGRYPDAEILLLYTLSMNRELYGEQHAKVAASLSWLASNLESQKKYSEAETLRLDALSIYHEHYNIQHPKVAAAMAAMASNLEEQNRYSEAEVLRQNSLAIYREIYGAKDQHLTGSTFWLAKNLEEQGKYAEAQTLRMDLLSLQRELHGEKHPNIAAALSWLAANLEAQGKYSQAQTVRLDTLSICRALYGEKHHDVAAAMAGLAKNLQAQGLNDEAEMLNEDARCIDYEAT
ncbi:MAG: tetratricopeptide repeat protein [Mariprofundus sp.]|nr:tetratricopeptide repeat protein [Mariprofundus sp.]